MTFTEAVKSGFRNYVNFTGRSGQPELWYWLLFAVPVLAVFGVIDEWMYPGKQMGPFSYVDMVVVLGALPPTLAVIVRRLNDFG